jgi:hypothetical protein
MSLAEDEIAYRGSVGDVNPSISVSSLFTSIPGPFTSWDDIGPPHVMKIQNSNTHQIYMVRQLTYSTELLACINQSRKQYTQRGGENSSQLNSTHSSSLYSSLSLSLTLFSLCFAHTHPQLFTEHICIQMGVKGHKSCHDLCHRLCPPSCAKWEIRYSHLHMVGHCLSPLTNTPHIHEHSRLALELDEFG